MKVEERAIELLKEPFVCNRCLGRQFGNLLSGYSNEKRGKIIRQFLAFLIDSGEKVDVELSNFYGIKFRNVKIKPKKPKKCKVCKNFFLEKIDKTAKKVVKELKGIEFNTFKIGSIVSDELLKTEEMIWDKIGIEFCESIKSEINRELGKRIEKIAKKEFAQKNPDVTAIVDMKRGKVGIEVRSLYIIGAYQKLKRGIPQTKWICRHCDGKGCKRCKGKGKMYPTSVQETIEKPFLKSGKSEESAFHGMGREDIDARCLGYRPFVIEVVKPRKRKIDLKRIGKQVNKSGKVKVGGLKFTTKGTIKKLKFAKVDKTYLTTVGFKKDIDKKRLKELRKLVKEPILQKTPLRVLHRRADRFRKRSVKKISWKVVGKRKLELRITGETGLYIKELITGDDGRTKPNVSELIDNEARKITLDVIKVHSEKLKL